MTLVMDKFEDVYVFSSFFYTKLSMSGYKGVHKWARSIELFRKRELLFPVHRSNHWCLVSVNMANCKLSLYDSLVHQNDSQFMDAIENYLHYKEAEEKGSMKEWTKEISQSAPQQDNFNDCGVYVCMNARNIAEQSSMKFYQDIPKTRKHIHNELLNLKLLQF